MKPDTSVLTPAPIFPQPSLPSLSDITQRFWEQVLGGVVTPQAGDDTLAQLLVGGRPWQ